MFFCFNFVKSPCACDCYASFPSSDYIITMLLFFNIVYQVKHFGLVEIFINLFLL